MASLRSLGVHKPAALQYLIAEGVLAADCSERDYTWETYHDAPGAPPEELITTRHHVVWARGGILRKTLNFEIEKEPVVQALLTRFPADRQSSQSSQSSQLPPVGGHHHALDHDDAEYDDDAHQASPFLYQGTQPATAAAAAAASTAAAAARPARAVEVRSRALVVFLKSQAHILFASGASSIVDLPFEVARAFPAARGVLLQRKTAPARPPAPASPRLPAPPPNSFLTTTPSLSQSLPQSLPARRPAASLLGPAPAPRPPPSFLDDLLQPSAAELPRVFALTDPLAKFGLVVNVVSGNEAAGLLTAHGSSLSHRRLEPLANAEEIIYVSPQNELQFDQSGNDKPLLLVVTANHETNAFTIWSAAYLEVKSLSTSRKPHVSLLGHKSRRRSSFGPTAPGTGTNTPAVRGADRARSKNHPPPAKAASNTRGREERLSDQAVEDALASQLNPDFEPSRQPRESRRVSSLLSRAELSTGSNKAAFQDLATQRTSLGGSFSASFGASQRSRHSLGNDRTSIGGFSQSRNRASTPGSITSRMSMGAASIDDSFEDLMDEDTFDTLEDYDELDDLFAPPDAGAEPKPTDGLRKEMVMSVVAEIPVTQYLKSGLFALSDPTSDSKGKPKAFSSTAPFNSATLHERKIYLYIVHPSLRSPLECELAISRKRLSPTAAAVHSDTDTAPPRYACVPRFVGTQMLDGALDATKVGDGQTERIVCLTTADPDKPCLSLTAGWGTHLPINFTASQLKLFNPYAILRDDQLRASAGLKRTIHPQSPLKCLVSSGSRGELQIIDGEATRHRLQLQLSPSNSFVAKIFRIISTILSNHSGDLLLEIWWNIRKSLISEVDQSDNSDSADWKAFVSTLFTLAVPFIDGKSRKPTNRASSTRSRTSGRSSTRARPDEAYSDEASAWRLMCSRQSSLPYAKSWESAPWAWVQQARPSSMATSPPSKRTQHESVAPLAHHTVGKQDLLPSCVEIARQFIQSPIGKTANDHWRRLSPSEKQDLRITTLSEILVTLHFFHEECKLDTLARDFSNSEVGNLSPVLAQMGHWLQWDAWSFRRRSYYDLDGGSPEKWSYDLSTFVANVRLYWDAPPSILEWVSNVVGSRTYLPFPTLAIFIRKSKASPHSSINLDEIISEVTPRTLALNHFFRDIDYNSSPKKAVELIEECSITPEMLATLPEAAKAPLMEAITRCQTNPPATWSSSLLRLVQREDLDISLSDSKELLSGFHLNQSSAAAANLSSFYNSVITRNVHAICQDVAHIETTTHPLIDADRAQVTRLIFSEDRRYMEAVALLEPLKMPVAEFRRPEGTEEAEILEGQKLLMRSVMIRTFSLPAGSSMAKFSSRRPQLTEKYPMFGFATSCKMLPMGNIVTADRLDFSEDKYFWSFFHAGVAAGLSISRDALGIDTSWFLYNKPAEPSNRHAGLLLGLGLNGHMKSIAKWVVYKYLAPKHTMTAVGLLLGLSASFIGTMDTLVTRMLSVHVSCLLPQGAAELNVSTYAQTTGLMGIGLLYYNSQHRRMSEIMLSEIEHVDVPDPAEPPDSLRDESYRLAAGFALGFINLGKGKDLHGLHDMRLVERLMAVAVAPKPVGVVHILDQATPGAVLALALIFMKTHDSIVARKIDVPDTLAQFDYVRADMFLLRTMAKHLIMWDNIEASDAWVVDNLPHEYRGAFNLTGITKLRSEQMPFFNILAGLLWSISLKYAGTGNIQVRDFLIKYLDQLMRILKLAAVRFDARLARHTVRNCQDLVALSCATVMAGTGDLEVLRRVRVLHGRLAVDVPYGSHFAGHMAFGALFLAGGTHTFGTSNKAIASLICAFYPSYPMDVQDSRAHLQAFRHFWVLAAEPRCLCVRDVDTWRQISMIVQVHLKDGRVRQLTAPCLLPEIDSIESIRTVELDFWPATLDFVKNPRHLENFRTNQTIHVRRRSAHDMYANAFCATLIALNDAQSSRAAHLLFSWVFSLPALAEFSNADVGLILSVDPNSSTFLDSGVTVVDHRLMLRRLSKSWTAKDLWELKGVFEWAEGAVSNGDGKLKWLGKEVVEKLKAGVLERGRRIEAA